MSKSASEQTTKISSSANNKVEGITATDAKASGGIAHWPMSLGIVIVGFVVDHATKYWAEVALKPDWWGVYLPSAAEFAARPAIQIFPGCLRLVYAENTGAAFSIMDGKVGLLGVISLVASIALFFFWRSLPAGEKLGRAAVALIFSGAIGNMVDRFFRGFVVDFIDAYVGEYHWPTFNIADSCICVGAALLIYLFIRGRI